MFPYTSLISSLRISTDSNDVVVDSLSLSISTIPVRLGANTFPVNVAKPSWSIVNLVRYLLNLEDNVQIPNKLSLFPLHISSSQGNKQIVELMISTKCEIDPKDDKAILVDILRHLFIMLVKKDIYQLFSFFDEAYYCCSFRNNKFDDSF